MGFNREFVIYGDRGIHEKVGQNFWDDVKKQMAERFQQDHFGEGLVHGIGLIGDKLAAFFPCRPEDRNETSNEIACEQ